MVVETVTEMEMEVVVVDGREGESRERDKVEIVMVEVVEAVEWGERVEVMETVEMEIAVRHISGVRSEETVIAKYVDFHTL